MPEVPPELIVEYLLSDPQGRVYWERAKFQAIAHVLAQRVEQLEGQGKTDG
jgi:hypothetical protein